MATTSIRWTTVKALVDDIKALPAASGVTVEPGWPGDLHVTDQMIWVDDVTSTQEIPVMSGTRMHRDDYFTITLLYRVANFGDLDASLSRLEELAALAEDVLADSPTLSGLDGVVSSEITATDMTAGRTPEGILAYGRNEVRVHARLT